MNEFIRDVCKITRKRRVKDAQLIGCSFFIDRVNGWIEDPSNSLLGDHRVLEPPESISNSVVKRYIADGSVGFPHVRVGHRQAFNRKTPQSHCGWGVLLLEPDELVFTTKVHVTSDAPTVPA